jgi:hypothetical protein
LPTPPPCTSAIFTPECGSRSNARFSTLPAVATSLSLHAGAGEQLLILFADLVVTAALGPGRHRDRAWRHGAQQKDRRANNGTRDHDDRDHVPVRPQEFSDSHAATRKARSHSAMECIRRQSKAQTTHKVTERCLSHHVTRQGNRGRTRARDLRDAPISPTFRLAVASGLQKMIWASSVLSGIFQSITSLASAVVVWSVSEPANG